MLAGVSQILVTLAFVAAPASKLAPCEYATLPLGAALGYLVWGDVPGTGAIAGAVLVAASVWLAALGGAARAARRGCPPG